MNTDKEYLVRMSKSPGGSTVHSIVYDGVTVFESYNTSITESVLKAVIEAHNRGLFEATHDSGESPNITPACVSAPIAGEVEPFPSMYPYGAPPVSTPVEECYDDTHDERTLESTIVAIESCGTLKLTVIVVTIIAVCFFATIYLNTTH